MSARALIVTVAVTALLIAGFVATGSASTRPGRMHAGAGKHHGTTACSETYFEDNSLLGPERLPQRGELGKILDGWHRVGHLSPHAFLAKYTNASGYIYPPDNGFLIGADGKPIEHRGVLKVGEQLDRFGSEYGAFLAPADTPYGKRSIPPSNLDDRPGGPTCNYYRYRVLKAFDVEEGPIAPAFGQHGHGEQFLLMASYVPSAGASINVMWLLQNCYLEREVPAAPAPTPCATGVMRSRRSSPA